MTDRKAKHRKLVKAGFLHVKGWVRAEKATECQQAIEEAKEDVDKALSENS